MLDTTLITEHRIDRSDLAIRRRSISELQISQGKSR
jgi:hypothetical protein